MVDRAHKISELPAVTAVANTDLFVAVANAAGNAITSSVTTDVLMRSLTSIVSAPATSTSTGKAGQIAFSSGYIYYCVATNTWKRAALSTW